MGTAHTSPDQVTGAPLTIKIGETDVTLAPLSLAEWGEFAAAVRSRRIAEFQKSCSAMDLVTRTSTLRGVLSAAMGDREILEEAISVEGAVWIVNKSARKADKAFDAVKGRYDDVIEASLLVLRLSGILEWQKAIDDKKDGPQPDPSSNAGGV
mgnify:CR=1 FL=1